MIVEHLVAETFGSHVGKYNQRLKVTQGGECLAEAPLLHLQSVIVGSRGVSISADAIEACTERGIPIIFLSSYGKVYATLYSSGLVGTVNTRREQLLAYYDTRGVHVVEQIARAKIQNQENTLKYIAKNRKESAPALYEQLNEVALILRDSQAAIDRLEKVDLESIRPSVMGIEGYAARCYWEAIGHVFPATYGWTGRETQGATDPLNSLLNYGYGILYSRIENALILAGLDPYAGFLHTDRAGKPSLVLDCIEEFRQIVIDRLVVGLAARHFIVEQLADGMLAYGTLESYRSKVLEHLDSSTRYLGKRYPLKTIIQSQARGLAAYLCGRTPQYEPFLATW
jgi:CRISPR-associated protein Cas1